VQGVTSLEPLQKAICRSVAKHERTAVKACHGVGKTFIAAKIALWFGSTFVNSKIITTAPTGRLVKELLWAEIRDGYAHSKIPLGGTMLTQKWELDKNWYALGFSPRKEAGQGDSGSMFQGFHAPYILIIFDEATGIPKQLWQQCQGMLTGGFVRFLAIGNPTTKACEFANCFTSRLWQKFTISCFDSPNLAAAGFTCKEDLERELARLMLMSTDDAETAMSEYPVVSQALVTAKWVMQRAFTSEWGIDHPLFISRVLAQFPDDSEDAIASLGQVIAAQQREVTHTGVPLRRSWGVDPARFGADNTAISVFEDEREVAHWTLSKKDTGAVAGFIVDKSREMKRLAEEVLLVDSTGIGAGVIDRCKENHEEGRLHPVPVELHFGQGAAFDWERDSIRSKMPERYANMKARIFDTLRKDIRDTIQIQDLNSYQEELPTMRYMHDSRGRFKTESKDDFKERTGRHSPDDSEALAIANFGRHIEIPGQVSPAVTFL
jgi:hypothetical protein